MTLFDDMIVTDIKPPVTIFSAWGRTFDMNSRPSFGLSFCASGQISYAMNGKKYISDPDHAVLLPKGGIYTLFGDKEGLFPLINFQCDHFCLDSIRVLPISNSQSYLEEYESLKKLFLFSKNRLKIYSAFYALLDRIDLDQRPKHDSLLPAIEYIEDHISDPELTNAALAEQAGISEVYFRKLFQMQYHVSPRQYILSVRLKAAQQMLVGSDASITSIAHRCGFSSPYHFSRIFKEKTGVTPTQYARENRKYRI